MNRRAGETGAVLPGVAVIALALGACGPTSVDPVELSSTAPNENADEVAAFFRRTCLDASEDADRFEAAVETSGWLAERTQSAGVSEGGHLMPSVWRLSHGELAFSNPTLPAGATFIDCWLGLDGTVAPSVSALKGALLPLVRRGSPREFNGESGEVIWQWRSDRREQRLLTVGPVAASPSPHQASGRPGVAIHFASQPAE